MEDGLVLLLIAGMVVTGYLAEGLRIAVNGDPWKMLSPVGSGIAGLFAGIGGRCRKDDVMLRCGGFTRSLP